MHYQKHILKGCKRKLFLYIRHKYHVQGIMGRKKEVPQLMNMYFPNTST